MGQGADGRGGGRRSRPIFRTIVKSGGRPLKVSSRQIGPASGSSCPLLGSRGTRGSPHYKYFSAILAASLPRSGDAAWPRPSYSDAARRVSGPSPLDLGDAAARRRAPPRTPPLRPTCLRRRVRAASSRTRAGARRGCAPRPGRRSLARGRRLVGVAATSLDDSGDARALGELVDIPRGCALSAPMQRVRPDPPSLTCGVRARGAAARTPVVARDVPRGEGDAHCAELDSCVRRRRFVGARRGHHR